MSNKPARKINDKPITAVALGNPPDSRGVQSSPRKGQEFVVLSSSLTGSDLGSTSIEYQVDPEIFDTGYLIIISYEWNNEEAACEENEILHNETSMSLLFFQKQIFPHINQLLPVTQLFFKTVRGAISVLPLAPPCGDMIYPLIPDALALPRVSISQLRRCSKEFGHPRVDLVTIFGHLSCSRYAFKHHTIPQEQFAPNEQPQADPLLCEVEHLLRLRSPYIMSPVFLVTDVSTSRFRGFLMPFLPAGTLSIVLAEIHEDENVASFEPFVLCSKTQHSPLTTADNVDHEIDPSKPFFPKLNWSLKHAWSVEVASAIVALHDTHTYCGDIKSDNILLDTEGHMKVIDLTPQDGFSADYTPPELWGQMLPDVPIPLSGPRDVFSLGLVLWQISEEVGQFERLDPRRSPGLVWGDQLGSASTPAWYRDLVERCVHEDANERPTTRNILELLEQKQ